MLHVLQVSQASSQAREVWLARLMSCLTALCARNAHITLDDVTTWRWVRVRVNLVNPVFPMLRYILSGGQLAAEVLPQSSHVTSLCKLRRPLASPYITRFRVRPSRRSALGAWLELVFSANCLLYCANPSLVCPRKLVGRLRHFKWIDFQLLCC